MNKHAKKVFALLATILFLSVTIMEQNAHARAGGGRSSGGGSRGYSRPSATAPQPRQQQASPAPGAFQQQPAGGFMRSMAGGLAGGMLGSMLFSSFAGAGSGAGGSSSGGIGLFEVILLAGGGYLLYRYLKKKRIDNSANPYDRS